MGAVREGMALAAGLALGALSLVVVGAGSARPGGPRAADIQVAETMQMAVRSSGEALPDGAPPVSYAIEARLDAAAHEVVGHAEITWRNTSREPQRELYLHLYLNAFRDEQSVYMQERLGGFRGGGTPERFGSIEVRRFEVESMGDLWPSVTLESPGHEQDATDIRVPLPEAVAPGDSLTIDVKWTSKLPTVVARAGYHDSFHMVAQWYPKLARLEPDGTWRHFPYHRLGEFYADFASYAVEIDVPEGFVVGATGARTDERIEDDRLRVRHQARWVHDFAFAAWDGFAEREVEADGVALSCLYPRGEPDIADIEIEAARHGLAHLSESFGPYPYDQLTIVHPPEGASEAGGMEYPTLITTGGSLAREALGVRELAHVTVHELAHQWFYGMLATNESRYPFLDEGLTTYATTRTLEARHPNASAFEVPGLAVSMVAVGRAAASMAWNADAIAQPAHAFALGSDYGLVVYQRTATLLETLRRVYGEPFEQALARYARAHRFDHPVPEDLLEAVRTEVGEHAAEQLRRGLFERGFVDYSVERATSEPKDGAHEATIAVRRRGNLELPVALELRTTAGGVERRSWEGRGSTWAFTTMLDAPLRSAAIDPELEVVLDHDLGNNHRRRDPHTASPRLIAVLGAAAHLLQGLGTP